MKKLALRSLFATTTRFEPSDPRNTIDATDVGITYEDSVSVVYGRVEEPKLFVSIIFRIPEGVEVGMHALGPGGINVLLVIDEGNGEEHYQAISGEIWLTSVYERVRYQASDFDFTARIGAAGRTVRVMMGSFDISA